MRGGADGGGADDGSAALLGRLTAGMLAAVEAPLAPDAQQELLSELVGADADLVREALAPSPAFDLAELVEHNPLIALQALIALGRQCSEILPALLVAPATQTSVVLVNRLTESVELPRELLLSFAAHCIETCEAAFVNYEEDEPLARLVAVLVRSFITQGLIDAGDIGTLAQGFAIDYAGLAEAAQLLHTLEASAAEQGPEPQPERELQQTESSSSSGSSSLLPLDRDSIVVLFRGGRLASWHALVSEWSGNPFAHPASEEHVDLMLTVGAEHSLRSIQGFKLLTPQAEGWSHWWTIEFDGLQGAEAWVEAEMRPPYGAHGYYDYSLARRVAPGYFDSWANAAMPAPDPPIDPSWTGDPRSVPALSADQATVVVVAFERKLAGVGNLGGSGQYLRLSESDPELAELRFASTTLELARLEVYQLISPAADWHRAWLAELPSLQAAEQWVGVLTSAQRSLTHVHSFQFARKHAEQYFASWVPARGAAAARL
jgi:hypothetical protein